MVNPSTSDSLVSSNALVVPSTMNLMMASEPMSIPGGIKLKGGSNYDVWSQFVTMFILGRGKKGYITGTTQRPDVSDATYDKWAMDDAIVKGWLINSMETDVMMLFIRLPIAKDIWDAASRTFYEGVDKSIIYDLSRKAMSTKQAGRPVSTYFSDLKFIWQELDHRRPIPFTQANVIKSSLMTVGGKCSHCGSDKHLVESCFKKNGYPEWWNNHKERLKARGKGKAALCTSTSSSLSVVDRINTSHSVVNSTLLQ